MLKIRGKARPGNSQKYLSAWEYLWNPALFVFSAEYFCRFIKIFAGNVYDNLC